MPKLALPTQKRDLQVSRKARRAAAKAKRYDPKIKKIELSGLLTREVLLGEGQRLPMESANGSRIRSVVVQSALLLPEGFGVCLWSPTEFKSARTRPEHLEQNARNTFKPFVQCSPTERAVLVADMDELMENLMDLALVAESSLEPEPAIEANEYFRMRFSQLKDET